MDNKNIESEISDIRNMMEESTRFLSLSGGSGVVIGVICLLAAYFCNIILAEQPAFFTLQGLIPAEIKSADYLILIAITTILLSLISAVVMSRLQAKRKGQVFWNHTSRRLLVNIMVPLVAGGIFILIIFYLGYSGLVIPLMLLIYGNALLHASKYTVPQTRNLAFVEMGLGIMAVIWVTNALWFWALGFGLVHIIYGIFMHFEFEK